RAGSASRAWRYGLSGDASCTRRYSRRIARRRFTRVSQPNDVVPAHARERVPGVDDQRRGSRDLGVVELAVVREDDDAVQIGEGAVPERERVELESLLADGGDVRVGVGKARALVEEESHDVQRGRLADVVHAGLVGDAEDVDPGAAHAALAA